VTGHAVGYMRSSETELLELEKMEITSIKITSREALEELMDRSEKSRLLFSNTAQPVPSSAGAYKEMAG